MSGETLKESVAWVEEAFDEWCSKEGTLSAWAEYVINELHNQKILVEFHVKNIGEMVAAMKADMESMLNDFKMTLQSVQEDVAILKRAVLQGSVET